MADRTGGLESLAVNGVVGSACRLCGASPLHLVLSYGATPLANALRTPDQLRDQEPRFPLTLAVCSACSLLQILETVPPQQLFRQYLYFSSYSDTMLRHAQELTGRLIVERQLSAGSFVVEIASNDGYLLQNYTSAGIPVLGIEPATNIADVANARQIPTLCEFFGATLGFRLRAEGRVADVVHAHNVLAHVPDLNGVIAGLAAILKPTGIAVIEVPYVKDMLDRVEFDTVYHEHLCYFSLTALDRLVRRHNLVVEHVERIPIHGGSLRCFVAPIETGGTLPSVRLLLEEEGQWGVLEKSPYDAFARCAQGVTERLVEFLRRLKREGKRIAAYGAAAKGSTLLNYAAIDQEVLDFVVDRSPYKQGRFMPGVKIPIYPPDRLLQDRPDYVVLLAWNFASEILSQQHEYRRAGGRFVIPLPELAVV